MPHQKQFSRVIEKFEACGDVGDPETKRKPSDGVPQNDVKAVQDFFSKNEEAKLQQSRILSQLLTILQKTWIQISSKEHVSLQR